ncbi:ATP-binding protein [Micromonospora echinofusca]|uniref:HTH luxR-type domain-containing protein n=1 Tax=Micromonospora echinofusca TaxID=47858 RepID=A0ABS3VNJ3_MICEH|nr:LuxR C-terminal-related transcriptional regulator [Micromonospora echinofusca]MBO4206108.1 hypothetical protein [Micromonospora echinofusca]
MSPQSYAWQLPEPLDSLVGREQELRRLRTLLPSHQLITLVGPGGVGKTRLGTELVRSMPRGRVELAFLAELDGVPDRGLPLRAMAEALGLGEGAAQRDWEALAEVIGERRMVTVLDSCERLLDSSLASVGSLLRRCPRLRIVATSREPLRVPGELVFPVEALSLPDLGSDLNRTAALRADAVRLFVARARCCDPTFELTDDNAGTVAEICHRLDGLPLAVELAARRIGALPPEGVLAALDDQLALLTDGSRTGPDRHRELRAAVRWSSNLLTQREKMVFRRLSVLVGGFDVAAAIAVCQDGTLRSAEVPGILRALVDKSLVARVGSKGGPIRYRQLNAFRAYGGELLATSGELPATRDRAAGWLARLARPITTTLCVRGVLLRRLREEQENLTAALRFTAAQTAAHSGAVKRDRHLLLAIALARVCQEQDRPAAGRAVLAEALDRVSESAFRGEALATAAALAARQHDLGPALRLAEEAVSVERASGRRLGLAKALDALSFAHLCRGENALAAAAQRECVAVTVASGRVLDIALARHNLAWQLLQTGELVEAEKLLKLALPVYRRHRPSPRAHAVGLHTAGLLHLMRGELATAEKYFMEGLGQAPADSVDGAPLVEALAIIAVEHGAPSRALRLAAAAAAARRRHDVAPTPDWHRRVSVAIEMARRQLDGPAAEVATADGERLRGDVLRSYALRGVNGSGEGPRRAKQILTEEELRIVSLVAQGATNREVADELRLSIGTIKARLTHILDTLALKSRTQLAVWAVRHPGGDDEVS